MLIVQPPYDRGFPWSLVYGDEKAIISETTALTLIEYGVTLEGKPSTAPDFSRIERIAGLSKKARRIIASARSLSSTN